MFIHFRHISYFGLRNWYGFRNWPEFWCLDIGAISIGIYRR